MWQKVHERVTEQVNIISVIPMKYFNMTDEVLNKAIKDKLHAKGIVAYEIDIHRSSRGTFIRGDVIINPIGSDIVSKTDFMFANCQVLPCCGLQQSDR